MRAKAYNGIRKADYKMTNAQQFIEHYSAVERYLRRTYGAPGQFDTFLQLITKAEVQHAVIRYYAADLREYGELRNAIVHKRAPEDNAIIAEPHSFVVERMRHIRTMIENPLRVGDVMTSPIFTATTDDLVYPTAQKMFQNVYTHVPVYDDKEFKGVLSESAILRWIGQKVRNDQQLHAKHAIGELVQWLDQSGNKFNDYEFMPKTMNVLDARRRFEIALDQGRRLGAIFITNTGKNTEKVQGIITAWDLPRLTLD